jgi:hypothetical protein
MLKGDYDGDGKSMTAVRCFFGPRLDRRGVE